MSIAVILDILQAVGLLNLFSVMFLVNLPAVVLSMYLYNSVRSHTRGYYLNKDDYNKDLKSFYRNTLEPLREDLNKLRLSVDNLSLLLGDQRVEVEKAKERLKYLDGRK